MEKKNILFVINSLHCGGAEKSLISMLTTFDYAKYNVDLQMFNPQGMFLDLLPKEVNVLPQIDYLRYCGLSMYEKIKKMNLRFLCTYLKTSFGLRMEKSNLELHPAQKYWKYCHNAINESKKIYDTAIAWGQGNPTHYVAEKVNAKKKIAFINADYEAVGHDKKFDYKYYEQYDYIAVVSEGLKEIMRQVFPDMERKLKTIYDINNKELIERMSLVENPFVGVEEKILVTVGRLEKPKGYDIAAEACRLLKESGICFKWYIVGEGSERSNIEQDIEKFGIQEQLILVGAKENPYVYMKNADVYVQTSKYEGFCLTVGEAKILNIPVVSTNFEVIHNQIVSEENGLIVDMDAKAVADGIKRMLLDNALRKRIICNLQKEKKGNIEEIEKLYCILEEVKN